MLQVYFPDGTAALDQAWGRSHYRGSGHCSAEHAIKPHGGFLVPKQPPGDDNVGRMQFLLGLRKRGISDAAVLRGMDEVPREHFVDKPFMDSAYADQALPIACGQTISQPYVVAYMSEHLRVQGDHRVLEVGTGSGYQTAVLSRLARDVISIERYRTLAETARNRMASLGYDNVE